MASPHENMLTAEVGLKNLVRVLQPRIVHDIQQPSRLLPHLGRIISVADQRKIVQEEKRCRQRAVEILVERLLDSRSPNWFTTFMEALQKERLSSLYKSLNLEDVGDGHVFEELLEFHFDKLLSVSASPVMAHLFEQSLITRQTLDEILSDERLYGNEEAMQHILLDLPFHHRDWLYHLVNALKINDYIELADTIDPSSKETGSGLLLRHHHHEDTHGDKAQTDASESPHCELSNCQDEMPLNMLPSISCHDDVTSPTAIVIQVADRCAGQETETELKLGNDELSGRHCEGDIRLICDGFDNIETCVTETETDSSWSQQRETEFKCASSSLNHLGQEEYGKGIKLLSDDEIKLAAAAAAGSEDRETYVKCVDDEPFDFKDDDINLMSEDENDADDALQVEHRAHTETELKYTMTTESNDFNTGRRDDDADDVTGVFDFRSTELDDADVSIDGPGSYTFGTESDEDNSTNRLTTIREKQLPNKQMPLTTNNIDSSATLTSATDLCIDEPLNLRGYQKELSQAALKGKNCLIIAPTGSGKTHVAMAIAKNHLENARMEEDRKVVFFVPTVALVEQQLRQFQRYMVRGCRCVGVSGSEAPSPAMDLGELVKINDVIVMTPQILLNALESNDVESLIVFSLLIFDECHRMTGSYSYNLIMSRYYVDVILTNNRIAVRLPQVVGLTASPGSGQSSGLEGAVDHILLLCANLAATEICTVRDKKNLDELLKHTNKPNEDTEEVRGRTCDPFAQKISQVMGTIETSIQRNQGIQHMVKEIPNIEALILPPASRGTAGYSAFAGGVRNAVVIIDNQNLRRFFLSCLRHLEVYNNSLMINGDCRSKDALAYINKEFQEFISNRGTMAYDETDRWLDRLFTEAEPELIQIANSPAGRNPKLDMLERKILQFYEDNRDSQGIIFCKTRETTAALVSWIKETPSLAWLNPHNLVGFAPAEKLGMTRNKLHDVLRYFKNGFHKIVVATSVAEEGLDVRTCNYVVRYEHVSNDIARVQARGRARAMDAQFVLIAERGHGTIERDDANRLREIWTNSALERLYTMDQAHINTKIREFQVKGKYERDVAAVGRIVSEEQKKARTHDGDYELRCVKCNEFISWSSDLRVVNGAHNITVDVTFVQRATFKRHPNPRSYDDWRKTHKMYCKKCKNGWGMRALYSGVYCCVLKAKNVVVISRQQKRFYNRKWKELPFIVAELTLEDMQILGENAMYGIEETNYF